MVQRARVVEKGRLESLSEKRAKCDYIVKSEQQCIQLRRVAVAHLGRAQTITTNRRHDDEVVQCLCVARIMTYSRKALCIRNSREIRVYPTVSRSAVCP